MADQYDEIAREVVLALREKGLRPRMDFNPADPIAAALRAAVQAERERADRAERERDEARAASLAANIREARETLARSYDVQAERERIAAGLRERADAEDACAWWQAGVVLRSEADRLSSLTSAPRAPRVPTVAGYAAYEDAVTGEILYRETAAPRVEAQGEDDARAQLLAHVGDVPLTEDEIAEFERQWGPRCPALTRDDVRSLLAEGREGRAEVDARLERMERDVEKGGRR